MTENSENAVPLIFAVGGAKGGVGKSMVCSNLAIQYAIEGLRVAVLDLDFGAANLHTIFGLTRPSKGWPDFFKDPTQNLDNYLTQTKQKNLYLLPSCGFIPEMADLGYDKKVTLIEKIKTLNVDVVFMDLGAGSSRDMVDFFSIADYKVLVTTSEPTALLNNYEFVKNVTYQAIKRLFKKEDKLIERLDHFKQDTNYSIEKFVQDIEEIDPWQAENLKSLLEEIPMYVVFNQIRKLDEAKAALRFTKICKRQLGVNIECPGFIFYNEEVAASVQKMLPITLVLPKCITSRIFRRIAHAILLATTQKEKGLLSLAFSHIEQDYKKNKAEAKRRLLIR